MADPFVLNSVPVQITSGTALSSEIDIGGWTLVGIVVPSNWTTSGLSFQASADGGQSFGELLDMTATAIAISSVPGGAQAFIAVDPTKWRGVRSLKVRSGTSSAPVNQTNTVTLQLLTRFVF